MLKNHNLDYYSSDKVLNPPDHVEAEILRLIDHVKNKIKSGQIIDFGAGTGRLTIPLLLNGYSVYAIEIDKKSISELVKSAELTGKINKLKIFNKMPGIKYQLIAGSDILHHLDLNHYLDFFYLHLEKNGSIIFSEPNPWHILWWLFIFLKLDWRQEKGLIHCSYLGLKSQLKKTGFKNIKISGFGLLPPQFFSGNKLLSKFNYFLGDLPLFKVFAYRLFFEAEK